MIAEQLRRFAEIGGWKFQQFARVEMNCWHTPQCLYAAADFNDETKRCDHECGERGFPNFSHPESLHLCFEVLERFCEERDWTWYLDNDYNHTDGRYAIRLRKHELNGYLPFVFASTKNAAIIKACLSAAAELQPYSRNWES